MTCEISILNRQAIALAADSATTVTEWIDGKEQVRFFKGANKIFQLSNYHQVGVMIFGQATLQEVSWELFIKEFRSRLGDKSFNDLSGYADELFSFVRDHHLFPQEYQVKVCKEEITKVAYLYFFSISQDDSVKNASTEAEKKHACQALLSNHHEQLKVLDVPKHFSQGDIDNALTLHKAELETELKNYFDKVPNGSDIDVSVLIEVAVNALFKTYGRFLPSTGVVIAGFGDNDYFPGYEEYVCYGILNGKCLFDKKSASRIDMTTPSAIKAFATTSMIDTFLVGCSPDVFSEIHRQFNAALRGFAESIRSELSVDQINNVDAHIEKILNEYTQNWIDAALAKHRWPLQRVIGALPIDEMAELAETLIMLQSLKEKVTQPTESVGGPIDVAVITKSDGFIWIKRKHYFDAKLNSRFFERQRKQIQPK